MFRGSSLTPVFWGCPSRIFAEDVRHGAFPRCCDGLRPQRGSHSRAEGPLATCATAPRNLFAVPRLFRCLIRNTSRRLPLEDSFYVQQKKAYLLILRFVLVVLFHRKQQCQIVRARPIDAADRYRSADEKGRVCLVMAEMQTRNTFHSPRIVRAQHLCARLCV